MESFFYFQKMKQLLFFLLLTGFSVHLSAQELTLIKTGRPHTFEYNNAERIVGQRWGIRFDYFAFNGTDWNALDSINALNQQSETKLAARKGADWNERFRKEVEEEQALQEAFRKRIFAAPGHQKQFLKEGMIHFETGKCKKWYTAYVFEPAKGSEEENITYSVYVVYKISKKHIKQVSSKIQEVQKPIHFAYPENGIL